MKYRKQILISVLVLLLFFVASYYVLTTSPLVRYWADDFCSSVVLRNNGFWQTQSFWWNSWTGRYSATFFTSFVELFGLTGAQILPVVLFVLFTVSLVLIFGFPLSILFVVIFLLNSPNLIQTFYWMTGSLNYFAPFIFLNFYLALLIRKNKKYSLPLGFVLIFIASGFSESFAVSNFIFLLLLLLIFYKRNKNGLIITGLVVTAISLSLMYFAPGNSIRSATLTHPSGLMDLFTKTFYYSKWYLTHLLYIKPFVFSLLTIIVSAFVFLDKKYKYFIDPKVVMIRSLTFMISITFIVVGLTFQAMNWEPPERVMTIVNYMIIYATIIFSIALFQVVNKYISIRIATIALAILIVTLGFEINTNWLKIRQELQHSIDSSVYQAVGKLDGLEENGGWVKSCIDDYSIK